MSRWYVRQYPYGNGLVKIREFRLTPHPETGMGCQRQASSGGYDPTSARPWGLLVTLVVQGCHLAVAGRQAETVQRRPADVSDPVLALGDTTDRLDTVQLPKL